MLERHIVGSINLELAYRASHSCLVIMAERASGAENCLPCANSVGGGGLLRYFLAAEFVVQNPNGTRRLTRIVAR